ncbi:hypothetical protein BAAM0483_08095 [Bifidobacterium animalis subsp. animalis MCC 0483]|uniref:WYL domain-containing protein n=1 Tax=Bifidobacterium animalis subsp. animalis MCC 0483 TaxID=1365955 RepID=A0AB34T734_9BIFI|nr:WYL domain-containing protein [Bifidobacterium animalis]KOA48436.1 hypothetical protein BAAM0483_08095 [Bifidobacterium animalis subsp. animalis MCC 0483]
MTHSRRGNTYSKNAILEIFGLLWEETDYQHGLTIPQIRQRLISRHAEESDFDYKPPSERTIREQLNWLVHPENTILNRPIRKVDVDECQREGIMDYTPGWYMSAYLSPAEMNLLADSLMLPRINDDMIEVIGDKIAYISGGRLSSPRQLSPIKAYMRYNTDFLHTIEELDRAIEHGWSVDFEYCNYDSEGELTPRRYTGGAIRHYTLDPYRMVCKTGEYYVLGHLRGADSLCSFVIDRIYNLQVLEGIPIEITLDRWQADGTLRPECDMTEEAEAQLNSLKHKYPSGFSQDQGMPLDPVKFIRQRPYMTTELATTVTLVLRADMLTPLFESFDNPQVLEEHDGNYLAQVVSPENAMLQWLLQHAKSKGVYVIQPQSLRNQLHATGSLLTRSYEVAARLADNHMPHDSPDPSLFHS